MSQELKKQIVLCSILSLILALSLLILWRVRIIIISKTDKSIELFQNIASIEANKAAFMKETEDFKEIKEKANSFEKYFFNSEKVPYFLSEIESQAKDSGIGFEITNVEVVTSKEGNQKFLQADFKGFGSYSNIMSFTQSVINKPYRISFSSFFANAQKVQLDPEEKIIPKIEWDVYGKINLLTFK